MVTEALITELIVADDIEPFILTAPHDDPIELQIRLDGENPETVELYLGGKRVFLADWGNNLYQVFKKAVERWPVE